MSSSLVVRRVCQRPGAKSRWWRPACSGTAGQRCCLVHRVATKRSAMTSTDVFKPALDRALAHSLSHLASAENRPVGTTASLQQLRERFIRPLPETRTKPEQIIDELVRDTTGGLIGSTGGRFFGWVIGGTLPAALAADWLTSAWD